MITIGILKRIKNVLTTNEDVMDMSEKEMIEWLGIDAKGKNVHEITYYTCLKMLSETLAKLPIKFYQDTVDKGRIQAAPTKTFRTLSQRPNPYMTASTFWSSLELNRNNYGNGYAFLGWKEIKQGRYNVGRELDSMWIMPSTSVKVLMDDKGLFGGVGELYYQYSDAKSGEVYLFRPENVLHVKTFFTYDGIVGKPVAQILHDNVEGALESQQFMNNLYRNGLTASMAMQFTGDLEDKMLDKLMKKYAKYFYGPRNAGKIVPVPAHLQLTPLDVKPVDAQFFELKKYTALQIAGAFGIKPNQINDYEKSSYANSETQQLAFLVDTMLYILKSYEEEMNYKILSVQEQEEGKFFKYNENAILRTDSKTKRENITALIDKGVYTVNYAKSLYDLPYVEGGDTTIVNGTYIPLTQVGKQYGTEGGEENED